MNGISIYKWLAALYYQILLLVSFEMVNWPIISSGMSLCNIVILCLAVIFPHFIVLLELILLIQINLLFKVIWIRSLLFCTNNLLIVKNLDDHALCCQWILPINPFITLKKIICLNKILNWELGLTFHFMQESMKHYFQNNQAYMMVVIDCLPIWCMMIHPSPRFH